VPLSGAGTTYTCGVRVAQSSVFSVLVFYNSLFVLFPFAIVLSILLLFMASDYPFGIFKKSVKIPKG